MKAEIIKVPDKENTTVSTIPQKISKAKSLLLVLVDNALDGLVEAVVNTIFDDIEN